MVQTMRHQINNTIHIRDKCTSIQENEIECEIVNTYLDVSFIDESEHLTEAVLSYVLGWVV